MLLPGLLDRFDEDFGIFRGVLPIKGVFRDLLYLALRLQDVLGCYSFSLVGTHSYFLEKLKVILIILVIQGLEVDFDDMVFVIVVVRVRLRHSLLDEVIVPIEVHEDMPLGPPQEGWREKFLLSHWFSIGA